MSLKTKKTLGRWLALTLVISLPSTLTSCKKREPSPEQVAYQQQLERCRIELGKSESVPIVGGGHVDISRFDSSHHSIRYEGGKCGTDMLELSFWWTGEEILPDSPKFIKREGAEIPKNWHMFNVDAILGNQLKARECQENIDQSKCSGFKGAVQLGRSKSEWPAELVVRLKNYPGLELWLTARPPSIKNQYYVNSFVIAEWRRNNGTPRSIDCWGLNSSSIKRSGLNSESLALLSGDELENINFQGRLQHGAACQVDFWDFGFNGGAARVKFSTEDLRVAEPALRAINKYLSDSIVPN